MKIVWGGQGALLFDFLTAEDIRIRVLEELQEAMTLAGLQPVHIPGDDFHAPTPISTVRCGLMCIYLYRDAMFHCTTEGKRPQYGGGSWFGKKRRSGREEFLAAARHGQGGITGCPCRLQIPC